MDLIKFIKHKKYFFLILVILSYHILMCDTANASFSIEDEEKLGREFYEKMEKSNVIIQNVRINKYINQVGQKILLAANKVSFDFHFYVIKSSAINAFSTPGGYVYINQGLINLTENESELASVLSHEIAHVNARHIADIIGKSQKINIATLAAILAGAFLGGGGDLSAAMMGFSLATATSLNLKYSREHEEEADRLGLSYLINAGYDGIAILDFLKLMRRYEFYSNTIPSYFLTHPDTEKRIRYLDGLLQVTNKNKGTKDIFGHFKRIKIILMSGEGDVDSTLKYYQNELKKDPDNVDALYGMALMQEKKGLTKESLEILQKALTYAPEDEDILRNIGICYFKIGQSANAIAYLLKASEINEDELETLLFLGRTYEATDNYMMALDIYKKIEMKNMGDDDLYYKLAMVYGKINNPGESHYNFGIYFKKKNKPASALFHYKEALKFFPPNNERSQEIEKEINSLNKISRSSN